MFALDPVFNLDRAWKRGPLLSVQTHLLGRNSRNRFNFCC